MKQAGVAEVSGARSDACGPWARGPGGSRQGLSLLLLTLILGTGLGGCRILGLSSLVKPKDVTSSASQFAEKSLWGGDRVVSRVLPVRIALRKGWQEAPAHSLHSRADLQIYHPGQNIYLVVLGESKTVVPSGKLEQQARRYLQLLEQGFTSSTSKESAPVTTQINKIPAVQYEVEGEVMGLPVTYLHTTLEIADYYYQVVVWTASDRYAANGAEMRSILQGFGSDQT
ncbi:MAG: hypothetical protein KGQ93_04965 [Cyanobacteria bacterium REEB459]|nr:hypothetical protein [Cyanobacteria bacterium REEB459]